MPAISTLSINDGTIAKTYSPVSTNGNSVVFTDNTADSSAGMPTLSVAFDPKRANRSTDRVHMRLAVPYEETVDGSPVVNHVARAEISVVLPVALPASERVRFASLLKNALAHADVQTVMTGPEAFY